MPPPPGALPGRPPPPQDRAILPFQQCQWVSLIDPTHPHPLLVQIASCSQPDCFSNIQVGSVLAVTNANIWTHSDTKVIYASSSVESQASYVCWVLCQVMCAGCCVRLCVLGVVSGYVCWVLCQVMCAGCCVRLFCILSCCMHTHYLS